MRNRSIKIFANRLLALIMCCILHMAAMAQDSSSYLDSIPPSESLEDTTVSQVDSEDGNTALFDTIKQPLEVVVREIPDTVVSRLKKDENYWYVNTTPEREKKVSPGKQSKWYQGAWFTQLLWIIVITSFVAIIIWFLASSNISLFRKKKVVINDIEEGEQHENIFTLDYGKELQKALAANDFRLATRLWYLSTLRDLADKELIEYQAGKTNSDYVAQLYNTPLYKNFSSLTRAFEYIWYGELALNEQGFTHLQKDFESFKAELAQ
ncbi:MAG TPA: DUF4129 domain-containing protein [Flavisolibacter sp.]|nr:DUF4129 domain-containing protein [Flavisolibacter sp.]